MRSKKKYLTFDDKFPYIFREPNYEKLENHLEEIRKENDDYEQKIKEFQKHQIPNLRHALFDQFNKI